MDALVPVDVLREERMPLNFFGPVRTQTLRGIPLEEPGNERHRIMRHVLWEEERVRENALIHNVHVLVVERRQTSLKTGGENASESETKGAAPTIISYSSTPRVHQSTVFVYPWFIKSSGAMYSGVPQNAGRESGREPRPSRGSGGITHY